MGRGGWSRLPFVPAFASLPKNPDHWLWRPEVNGMGIEDFRDENRLHLRENRLSNVRGAGMGRSGKENGCGRWAGRGCGAMGSSLPNI
jgi:hypothetical protein